ncbi:acetyl-CoA carboxylase biotin carboxyl carrier protein [bacterium]|nr:acetyl-CoA carboxylase biotin carboxyl carrier protein [bacterium]
MKIDDIEKIIQMLKDSDISELTIEQEGVKFSLKRDLVIHGEVLPRPAEVLIQSGPASQVVEAPVSNARFIKAKMPGTFYSTPSPESPDYVKVGDTINDDTVVCIIEAMKIFNEIKAEMSGKIVKVLVESGESLEYDQPIFEIE